MYLKLNIGSVSFQDQVVFQENMYHYFISTHLYVYVHTSFISYTIGISMLAHEANTNISTLHDRLHTVLACKFITHAGPRDVHV